MIDYRLLLKECYQEDVPDNRMIEEAIVSIENYFDLMSLEELCHHSRPLAIAYLALCYAEQTVKECEKK